MGRPGVSPFGGAAGPPPSQLHSRVEGIPAGEEGADLRRAVFLVSGQSADSTKTTSCVSGIPAGAEPQAPGAGHRGAGLTLAACEGAGRAS